MSNSSLVDYTQISPNKTSPRNHKIDTITIHCTAGQCSVEGLGSTFAPTSREASSNYGIGYDGRIGMYVEEKDRSWCSSNRDNDNRAITIEVASDSTHPYAVKDAAYESLIKLLVDICKRNDIKELKWKADKSLIGQVDKQNMTVHRWFANKACPGDYLYERHSEIAAAVNKQLGSSSSSKTTGTQAISFKDLDSEEVIKKVGTLFTEDQKNSGILASVSLAQFVLESGYGKSELAQNANNCFGMKTNLSGNTWSGSSWDGQSKYTMKTKEYTNGQYATVDADFRKYSCVEDSITDHSAYLLGATNGNKKRYEGLKSCVDHKKAIEIIKDGGYATAPNYVDSILNIINKWDLKQYDYSETTSSDTSTNSTFKPYTVKVEISHLNIRTGPGTNYDKTGQYTGVGVFTIVEESSGVGASKWGKLKSGAGWISLDYAKKL